MSKLIKKDTRTEENSNHISQMKASIDSLITTYGATQHIRRITPSQNPIPEQGVTAGVNNCYWLDGYIQHGVNSKSNENYCLVLFHLPSDYVAGEDLILNLAWITNLASEVVDYWINLHYTRNGVSWTGIQSNDATWTGEAVAWCENQETITVDGTNLLPNDKIRVLWYMEDDNNANIIYNYGSSLDVPVNTRT